MQDAAYWIFLGLAVFFVIAFIIWHKRNMRLLTIKEKRKMWRAISRATRREMQYVWLILGFSLGFLLLIKLLELSFGFYLIIMTGFIFQGFFRNIRIYRKINLPEKFVTGEIYLGTLACLFMGAMTFWNFWQK